MGGSTERGIGMEKEEGEKLDEKGRAPKLRGGGEM